MMDLRRVVLAMSVLALATVPAASQIPTCGGTGLSVTGGRFGDTWSIGITGPPGAAAALAADVGPGPVVSPFGAVCLALSPALTVMPVTLNAAGTFTASGTLPIAPIFPAGSTQFVEAAIASPAIPGGFSLTNGFGVTFRPPIIGLIGITGPNTTSFTAIDASTDTVIATAITPLPFWGYAVSIPHLDWFGWRDTAGSFYCVDSFTGSNVLTIPNVWGYCCPTYSGPAEPSLVHPDGTYLIRSVGSYFGNAVWGWSLPSGAPTPTVTLPASPPYYVLAAIPGTSLVYCSGYGGIIVVDLATGLIVTSIALPSFPPALVSGNRVFALSGNWMAAVDTTTHTVVAGPVLHPNPAPGSFNFLTTGPGSAGTSLWAWGSDYLGPNPFLYEISPTSLAILNTIPLPAAVSSGALSAGGSELILELADGAVYAFNPIGLQLMPIVAGPVGQTKVLRSSTLRKAYTALATGLVSFPTDPASPVTTPIPSAPPVWILLPAQ